MNFLILFAVCRLAFGAQSDADLKKYQEAVKNDPGNYAAYNRIGLYYAGIGKHAEAAENFSKAVTVNNDFYEGFYNLGLLYYQQGKTLDALARFKQALLISKNADLYVAIMNCLIRINSIDFASRYFEEALKSHKENYKVLNSGGIIELYRNNFAKAREYFASALKLKDDSKIKNNLAIAEYYAGNREAARQALKGLKKDLKLYNENFELISK